MADESGKSLNKLGELKTKQGYWKPICDAWVQGFDPEFTKRVAQGVQSGTFS